MNKKIIVLSSVSVLSVLPFIALAFNFIPPSGNANLSPAVVVVNIINFIWPIIVAVVVIAFIVAGILFVVGQGEPGALKTARSAVIWGVVGIVVILLAFSIINIVQIGTGLF